MLIRCNLSGHHSQLSSVYCDAKLPMRWLTKDAARPTGLLHQPAEGLLLGVPEMVGVLEGVRLQLMGACYSTRLMFEFEVKETRHTAIGSRTCSPLSHCGTSLLCSPAAGAARGCFGGRLRHTLGHRLGGGGVIGRGGERLQRYTKHEIFYEQTFVTVNLGGKNCVAIDSAMRHSPASWTWSY